MHICWTATSGLVVCDEKGNRKEMKSSSVSLCSNNNNKLMSMATTTTATSNKETMEQHRERSQSRILSSSGQHQFSSFLLFASLIILINLCPFQAPLNDLTHSNTAITNEHLQAIMMRQTGAQRSSVVWQTSVACVEFVKLMFSSPIKLNKRVTRFSLAEARVLGKMAKVWYIKKKIKKLSKKLKKHTIAVPVFTAIPIYEHSYYPSPHVTHVSHGGMHHAAAASSYAPSVAHLSGGATGVSAATSAAQSAASSQQLAAAASNTHQQVAAYRMAGASHHSPAMYQHHHPHHQHGASGAHPPSGGHHIINAYAPQPPLFVDDTGGLYGHYGNAYGRYDGGYHYW